MDNLPADHWVKTEQFVPTVHRDAYPTIDPTQPSLSQKGKVIIITGASQGIGSRALVPAFAAAGAKALILVSRGESKLNKVAAEVKDKYPNVETLVVPTNLVEPSSVAALFEKVKEEYGHADVLINNAGVMQSTSTVKDVAPQAWWHEMEVNVLGPFLMTHHFLKSLPTPSTPARIITVTSAGSYKVFPTLSSYGISKMSAFELMTYVAVENPNVIAVALHPGTIKTDMTIPMFEKFSLDTPELAGGVTVWLAAWESEDRAWLSGRFVNVNWDVGELVARKEEIVGRELLKLNLDARLGAEQFGA